MNVVCVDDENMSLNNTIILCKECGVDSVFGFSSSKEALDFFKETDKEIDIAFLDIDMPIINGIEMAKMLKTVSPNTFIIFISGYKEYALEAYQAHAIGYLTKPISQEELQAEIDRVNGFKGILKKKIKVFTFGNFEVFYNDKPVEFKYRKTKELFAYLIDRNGVDVSTSEIMAVLFEEDDKSSYLRNLISDLVQTFDKLDDNLIRRSRGMLGLNKTCIDCDYYEYLKGDKSLFQGEYMSQYSFAEYTLGYLIRQEEK